MSRSSFAVFGVVAMLLATAIAVVLGTLGGAR